MREKIIEVVQKMQDINEDAANKMRAQLQPLSFAELSNLHN